MPHWLNGESPGLCEETPEALERRIDWSVNTLIDQQDGPFLVVSHFENVTYVHGRWVCGKQLGEIPVDWEPTKSGGVALFVEDGQIRGLEYDPEFNIVC